MRGARRPHAGIGGRREAGGAGSWLQCDQPRRGGRRPRLRPVPGHVDRRAVGTRHGRAVGHPVAPGDPPRSRDAGPEGAVPAAVVPRRAARRVRDHGGGRGLGRLDGADDGATRRRRLGGERREVARDLRRRRRLLLGPRARRRRPREGHRVPGRQGRARSAPGPHACVHAHVRVRTSDLRVRGRARRRGPGARRRRRGARPDAGLVRGGTADDRRPHRRGGHAGVGAEHRVRIGTAAVRRVRSPSSRPWASCLPTVRPS